MPYEYEKTIASYREYTRKVCPWLTMARAMAQARSGDRNSADYLNENCLANKCGFWIETGDQKGYCGVKNLPPLSGPPTKDDK